VRTDGTQLKRWNQRLFWVLSGSSDSSLGLPNLWVEKGTFFPHRFIKRGVEVRFDQFSGGKFSYPQVTSVLSDEKMTLTAELVKLTTRLAPKNKKQREFKSGFTELGLDRSSRLQGLIEQFYSEIR